MFDLSNSKWGHGPIMGFLPAKFELATPLLDLGSSTGQTDEQTDESSIHYVHTVYGCGA